MYKRIFTFSGRTSSTSAIFSTISSPIITPCGPPKPRKAVFEGKLVLQTRPRILATGMLYALKQVNMARSKIFTKTYMYESLQSPWSVFSSRLIEKIGTQTDCDKSKLKPPLQYISMSTAVIFPSFVKPT